MSMNASPWALMRSATQSESLKGSRISRETVGRVVRFARPHSRMLLGFLLTSVVVAVLGVITPVLAGRVVNAITGSGSVDLVVRLALLIALIAVLDAGFGILNRWLSSTIGEGLILDLRTAVYDHVQTLPVAFFTRTRTGALISRLNNDVLGAQRAFSNTLSGVVSNLVSLILTVGVMVSISWQVTLLSVLLLPIFLIPARLMGGRLARLQREAAQHNASMSTQMTERFSAGGATLIKLFGKPQSESDEFARRAGRVRTIGVRVAMLQATFLTALTLVSALALALVYGVGGVQAIVGNLDAGQVVTLALLLTRLYTPLTMLSNARLDIMSALVSFERVFEILDLEPLIREPENPRAIPDGPVSVEFDQVRFTYPSAEQTSLASLEDVSALDSRVGEEVLHGVDFTVEHGQTVALVGSSGAGKSTIASLVPRLYDATSGAVRIGGVDVRETSFTDLQGAVGMVTQDGHLFHETIRQNLALAAPDADDEQMWSALSRARMDHVVRELGDGLDTMIGERGYRLSGGERQRLTIARLLLASPRVVILDEATSALDSTSEAFVQAALDEAMAERTALVIAHRLSTIRRADRILVIEGGRVVEQGPHDELLAAGGRYAELYETQFADQE
ncbi:ABC transporter ATP-binding protein [Kocuria palustris]|jgi:ATP-binding cassette subfamily B protein|uniref:ABC transporter ATP-binding protein n=1 Tax=Kocuria palustris TaxID=71999 RepID=UPI0019D13BD0|nr:ABC transporter ATP-binding protein [Kocuria palustris]MBN6753972.1 ABC transporter ATP-binding protein [Kocuria palustris]MBN6758878.1 ABC transporter ATP-binding protein [Kocuria palustris]MBN6764135.1 ABC transporter ATP-binding protein [Kocuria palustris]MBN6783458.1 ABC transporter ATP-binding protein [Kocuria palustris]MBN6800102.1 ABC transporter ATP-binding protein [Kocuria palustris]